MKASTARNFVTIELIQAKNNFYRRSYRNAHVYVRLCVCVCVCSYPRRIDLILRMAEYSIITDAIITLYSNNYLNNYSANYSRFIESAKFERNHYTNITLRSCVSQ